MQTLCGMRLTTAGVVIGWIGAAVSLLSVVIFSLCLDRADDLTTAIVDHMNDPNMDEVTVHKAVVVICTVYLTINAINLLASALLIIGTIKERHLLLIPWLMNTGISLFFGGVYFIYFVVNAVSTGAPFGPTAISLTSSSISLAVQWIVWNAIRSLYKQLQAGREVQQHLIHSAGASYPSYSKI